MSNLPALFRLQDDLAEALPDLGLASGWPLAISILKDAIAERNQSRTLLDALYDAAKVDQPDEGKHELAVRIMRMIRP